MEDRFKFKVLDTTNNKLYPNLESLSQEEPNAHFLLSQDGVIIKKYYNNGEIQLIRIEQYRPIFCVGLHDNTNWEQLSQEEKQDFYNHVNSEDGMTLKYRNIEDVKHLWKGKLIYEGDIVQFKYFKHGKCIGVIKYVKEDAMLAVTFQNPKNNQYDWNYISDYKLKVVGNIYENPELLSN